jgi:hypothetical protein
MARPKKKTYFDFDEYVKEDPDFFLILLADRTHDYQRKIVFQDGSSYNVSKGGHRRWNHVDFDGDYIGFKGENKNEQPYWYSILTNQHYDNERDYWQAQHFALGF